LISPGEFLAVFAPLREDFLGHCGENSRSKRPVKVLLGCC
jgi:hypothetical protein